MNKASRSDGVPAEQLKILKDDAVKVLHSICQQVWKPSIGCRTEKGQFSLQSQRKLMPKNVPRTAQFYLFHLLLKPGLKDFQHNLANTGNDCNCMVI